MLSSQENRNSTTSWVKMSRYIRLLNCVKTNIAALPLTCSQIVCRTRIEERLAYPGVVNLYGPPGTGKTVLGWMLSNDGDGVYVVHPTHQKAIILQTERIVFIDNAEAERSAFRRLIGDLESAGIQRAVIVTRTPADDYVFRTELNLTDDDIGIAQKNLLKLGYPINQARFPTLWHLALQAAKEG